MTTKHYPYAVLDRNLIGTDGTTRPYSVHLTREAAIRAADQYNRRPGYSDAIAVQWTASRVAREQPDACLPA